MYFLWWARQKPFKMDHHRRRLDANTQEVVQAWWGPNVHSPLQPQSTLDPIIPPSTYSILSRTEIAKFPPWLHSTLSVFAYWLSPLPFLLQTITICRQKLTPIPCRSPQFVSVLATLSGWFHSQRYLQSRAHLPHGKAMTTRHAMTVQYAAVARGSTEI